MFLKRLLRARHGHSAVPKHPFFSLSLQLNCNSLKARMIILLPFQLAPQSFSFKHILHSQFIGVDGCMYAFEREKKKRLNICKCLQSLRWKVIFWVPLSYQIQITKELEIFKKSLAKEGKETKENLRVDIDLWRLWGVWSGRRRNLNHLPCAGHI